MPLPVGFKVNGLKVTKKSRIPVSPQVQKMMSSLDALPLNELLTTLDFAERLGWDVGGRNTKHPALRLYCEKVDNRMFWGNRKSIASLRRQLDISGEPHDKN